MFEISAETYADATKVHTITVGNRTLFWVKMHHVQDGLGIKNIYDLIRKENSWYFWDLKILQNIKSENIKYLEGNGLV